MGKVKIMINDRETIEMPPLDYKFPNELSNLDYSDMNVEGEIQPMGAATSQQAMSQHVVSSEPQHQEQEVVQEVYEEEVEEDPIDSEPVQQLAQPKKQGKSLQENIREVRLAKEKAERERDALVSAMLNMQSQLQKPQQQAPVEPKEWFDNLDPESLVEGKQVQMIAQDMRAMKKMLAEQQRKSQELEMQNKIRAQYPDIDSVVNDQTIKDLNEMYPAEASALGAIPDRYNQAVLAYTTIKNLGIYKQDTAVKRTYVPEALRAKANASKPRPLASISPQQGESPLSQANVFANGDITKEMEAKMYKEMRDAIARY
jgi:hypothetical protein